jgi:dienelactone hydrolase
MELKPISYRADGLTFTGYMADGSSGEPSPGVLVIHESGGLVEHTKARAAKLGELGYVALAMDLYGEPISGLEGARAINRTLIADISRLRGRCRAALDALAAQPGTDPDRLAAIGYCFGGAAAIELARDGANLACVAGFHSGFIDTPPPEDDRAIRGKVLICQGAEDPVITAEQRDAFISRMMAAGIDWQMHLYGGVGHSFTNRGIDAWNMPGFTYHEAADRRSWTALLALFDEVFA